MSLNETNLKGLAQGIEPLSHQVAGHRPKLPNSIKAFYQAPNGTILKHMRVPLKNHREHKFYRLIFEEDTTDPILKELKNFLPKYFGTIQLDCFPDEHFIQLRDITHSFDKPCIADIKIGRQTYHPTASPEKIEYEKFKYPRLPHIGFRIGFRVYRPCSESYEFHDHKSLLSLENSEILEKGVGSYFNLPEKLRKDAILAILLELKEIHKWFELQRTLSFYSTSLLCVYEGSKQCDFHNGHVYETCSHGMTDAQPFLHCADKLNNGCNQCCPNRMTDDYSQLSKRHFPKRDGCVQVKMIDFNHVYATTERDENYLFGLNSIMKYLEKLMTDF